VTRPDPGSFRDPASHIVFDDDRVIRLLDQRGLEGWKALSTTKFFARAVADGRLIGAESVDPGDEGVAGALEHPRIPFISYPYEWTFSMMRDAALLQLDLLADALAEGITIKDSNSSTDARSSSTSAPSRSTPPVSPGSDTASSPDSSCSP